MKPVFEEKFVVQYRCKRWVNCKDVDGKTKYFDDWQSAYDYMGNHGPDYRIVKYLGGRKYWII